MDLERKFVVALVLLLAASCAALYGVALLRTGTLAAIVVMGASVGLLSIFLAHALLFRPIRQLAVMGRAIGAGDFSKRLHFARRDEIGSLASEMDAMCDQLAAARLAAEVHSEAVYQLRHSDRISTLGRIASSVAHELGNPLNVIELRAQLITSDGVTSLQQARQNAAVIIEQTRRMTHIIDEILSFARRHPARIEPLDLVGVLHQAVALSLQTSRKHRASIAFDLPPGRIDIDGDADKLLQVFVNLVLNGIEAMPNGGALTLRAEQELRAPVDDLEGAPVRWVRVDVVDQGVGIEPALLPKVFDAFCSTKSAEGGTGLGLSIAQGIAHEHGGWISVVSEPGHGSTFSVYLPEREARADVR